MSEPILFLTVTFACDFVCKCGSVMSSDVRDSTITCMNADCRFFMVPFKTPKIPVESKSDR